MAEMQRQMASMPPGFLEKQMQAMQGMSPDVLQQQMAAADRMDPAAMDQQLKGAATMARQQEEYQVGFHTMLNIFWPIRTTGLTGSWGGQVRASNQLKEEGNRLFSAQKTTEAIEKYQRAKSNLSGYSLTLNFWAAHSTLQWHHLTLYLTKLTKVWLWQVTQARALPTSGRNAC